MTKSLRTLTIFYDTMISEREVPLFRGAVLRCLDDKANILYHNHTGDNTFRYSYPLVQYKRLDGKAAITCIEEGVDLVGQLLSDLHGPLSIGQREVDCHVAEVKAEKTSIEVQESLSAYQLHHWLPLNGRNYALYQSADRLVEKVTTLERVLTGNILSFLKGVGIHVDEQLRLSITEIMKQQVVSYKQVNLMSFDVRFKANIPLPSFIGIGKNASLGYGILTRIS